MLLGEISYCMPAILENDDLVIIYNLPVLDVIDVRELHILVIYILF